MKQKFIFVILILLTFNSCSFFSESSDKKEFYETYADWDYKYIPIIPPLRAMSGSSKKWMISHPAKSFHMGQSKFGAINLGAFGVSKNYIYGTIPGFTSNNGWFLLNTDLSLYTEYSTKEELITTLKKYKLDINPIKSCEEYYAELADDKRCYWFPDKGEQYPTYPAFQPDSSITIQISENGKATDFKLSVKIKRDVSKIYYFKLKYNKPDNDLLYVSFDSAPPKRIVNNEIIAAYAERSPITISVYTPYPIGVSKGIKEKDRIVVSKNIELTE